jgi:hypothetical protein
MKQTGRGRGRGTEETGARVAFGPGNMGTRTPTSVFGSSGGFPTAETQKNNFTEGEVSIYPGSEHFSVAIAKSYDGYRISWFASMGEFTRVNNDAEAETASPEDVARFKRDIALAAAGDSEQAQVLQEIISANPELQA